jgi:uncharacterized membrane protein
MKAATFDPVIEEPDFPDGWVYDSDNGYYLVQCRGPIQSQWFEEIETKGATILGYIPNYTYLVHMVKETEEAIKDLPFIRWIGIYHPAYKILQGLSEKKGQVELNVLVFKDNEENLQNVRNRLRDLNGAITYHGESNHIIRIRLDTSHIRDIAFIPEVEWIDEYTPPVALMNNIRVFTGAENLHSNGFSGSGIVGEVKDSGFDEHHPDYEDQIVGTDGNPPDSAHGTCTFGIVFSNGENDDNAMGMMPEGEGAFAYWGVERIDSISNLVENWGGVFQSNSWHMTGQTDGTYNSNSQENDQAIFDYDVTMLYAAGNSNDGVYSSSISTDSAAKNVICVGAVFHYNDDDRTNDQWVNNGQYSTPSQGPASDGRVKPDLAGVFDAIYTTDGVDGDGNDGYASGNYTNDFGGTSGATPIAAGAAGLVYQMYRENFFTNNPSGAMPHAATVKAILIANAYQYELSAADRYQQGWGGVDIGKVYEIGKNHFIVDEDTSLETGEAVDYTVSPISGNPLKISLVWTDVPGTTSSSQHLVNDIDLRVTDPNNEVYLGNVGLLNSKWSSTGGDSDTLNNVENVFIENPVPGDWTIEVLAQNIAMDGDPSTPDLDQRFALVASGVSLARHDLGVSEIQVPTYLAPNQATTVNATIINNGLSDEVDILVNFTVDGDVQDAQIIPTLESEKMTFVDFDWIPQTGIFMVGIQVEVMPDENNTANNFKEKEVIVEPDLSVTNITADKYLKVNENEKFNATINNLGKIDLNNIQVQLFINDSLQDSTAISFLPAETSQGISLEWAPEMEGWLKVEIYAVPVTNEEIVSNNVANISRFTASKEPILVAILDSWGTDFSEEAPWDYMVDNWMFYGTTPVEIDYTTLNKDDITYDNLVELDADVIMISCAFMWEFSDSEIDAITDYVHAGYGMIATSATFYWNVPNNNMLAPLFGIRDDITYDAESTPNLDLIEPEHPLFVNIPNPYATGSAITALPTDNSWDASDLTNGIYLAKSSDDMGAIVVNRGAVFITHWIEYESNNYDIQLLYNAMIWSKWEQELHDVAVVDIQVPKYLQPNQMTFVNATVANLGLGIESDILVNLSVNGNLEDSTLISSIDTGDSISVSFDWTAPSTEESYLIEIEVRTQPNENFTQNNEESINVIVTTGPKTGRLALISDGTQLNAITSILDEIGKQYDILNDNAANLFTGNITLLLDYQMVIFYNGNRLINNLEWEILNDYISLGGALLVTGHDSLGSPDDALLADLVRSTAYGDNMGLDTFTITNGSHPITEGIFGLYPEASQYIVSETDHDLAEADLVRGAQTVAELSEGSDKIISTELPSGGKVIYWNGNRNCLDWTQVELEGMLKNLIVWIMPVYDDIGVISISNSPIAYVGDTVSVSATVKNYGINHQNDIEVDIYIINPNGFTIFTETKSGISVDSGKETQISWLWYPAMSDIYSIEILTLLSDDEFSENNLMNGQITVYSRFFLDDVENGMGDWEVSDTSPVIDELWHQTGLDSHSPTTSWWCGDEVTVQYTVLADQFLTSPEINLTEATSASLRFYHKYGIDDFSTIPNWGEVQINTGASGWDTLQEYTGFSLPWTPVVLNISSYIGNLIKIRFVLNSGVLLTDNGWWVDDVEIFGMENQYGIELSVFQDTIAVGKNEPAVFGINVKNSGNALGSVEMSLDTTGIGGWIITFSQDVFDIQSGDTVFITLTIDPVSPETGDHFTTVTGDMKEGGDLKAISDLPLTVFVNQWYDVDITVDNDILNPIPDETVHYNVTIVNTGNGPDSFSLTTEDFIFGTSSAWQFELSKTSVSLNAYQKEIIELTVTAPSDGHPDDNIVINVIGTSQGDVGESASVSTTTIIIEYYLIELSSSPYTQETDPGTPVTYVIGVKNHGNSEVNVNLDLSTPTGGWDNWLAVLEIKNFKLSAFELRHVMLSVTPAEDAVAFGFKEFNVNAISSSSSSMITLKTTARLSGHLSVEVEEDEKEAENQELALFQITLTNMQNHRDTIDITSISENGWPVFLFTSDGETLLSDTDSDGKLDTDSLDPLSGSLEMIVGVEVPEDARANKEDEVRVIFKSSLQNGSSETIFLRTNVKLTGGFILESESYTETEAPGETISYLVTIQNHFNDRFAIDLTASSANGWEVGILKGDGDTHLSDADKNGNPDTGFLNALGGSMDVMVKLQVPEDAVAYTTDVITLTGTAWQSGGSNSIKLNATVRRIYNVETILEDDDLVVERGGSLVYTIEISNNGNYDEALDLRFSDLPQGWGIEFSNDAPHVPIDGSRTISITMMVPKDADTGIHEIVLEVTSDDGTPADELTLYINVKEGEDEFEIPFIWLLLILLVISGIIIAVLLIRRSGKVERERMPVARAIQVVPKVYQGPIFPSLEMISCPVCYNAFEVESRPTPFRVQCPRCGASGMKR